MDLSRELRMRNWVLKHVKLCSTYSSDNTRLNHVLPAGQARAELGTLLC